MLNSLFLILLLTQDAAPGFPFHTASAGHLMMLCAAQLGQLFFYKLTRELELIDYFSFFEPDPAAESFFSLGKLNDSGSVASRYTVVDCTASAVTAVA